VSARTRRIRHGCPEKVPGAASWKRPDVHRVEKRPDETRGDHARRAGVTSCYPKLMTWRVVAQAVVMVGCTVGGPDAPALPRPTITADEFIAREAVLSCERERRCEALNWGWGECHPDAAREPRSELVSCPGNFSPHAAERCLALMASHACQWMRVDEMSLVCNAVFASPLPEGSTCERWGCGEGTYCGPPADCSSCRWACRPRRTEGQWCTRTTRSSPGMDGMLTSSGDVLAQECADGLDCVWDPVDGTVCVPRTVLGAPCAPGECSPGQACVGEVCVLVEEAGVPCRTRCGPGLRCEPNPDGGATCLPRLAFGEACTHDVCEPTDTLCSDDGCADGLRCAGGACATVLAPGAACGTSDTVCPSAFHCRDGTCVPDPVVGEPCIDEVGCAIGVCREGVCVALAGGAPCDSDALETFAGLGPCEGICESGTCSPVLAEGADCGMGVAFGVCERGTLCDFTRHCVRESLCR
jgi:hypothetical protein